MPWNLGSFIQWDGSKIDRVKLRKWLLDGAMLLEPAIITPGNLDQLLFEQLDGLIQRIIDGISREDGSLIVGDAMLAAGEWPVSMAEVSQFLASFPEASDMVREMIRENPALVRRLAKFTRADQELIMGNPLLLAALQMLLPLLFQLLLRRFRE
jgi:hypothetical protein